MSKPQRKKLIEVALPLEAINEASAREKSIRHGHPSTLHLWWARRPLAAARAVIFAQMVDDPSSWPDLFPTEKKQEQERQRLFDIIEELVQWESTTNEEVLQKARDEIWRSWRRTCAENADHPQAKELFDRDKLPGFHDPFAGGGALPLEAQRLGLESFASDLNPVAVLINKAMIEIPPRFANQSPVNPDSQARKNLTTWKGAQGLAEDVRYYGKLMRDEAEKRIGHLYPKVKVTKEMVAERPDLKPYEGKELTVIAWLWARTVKSPNPAFREIDVPLASSFVLSSKPGKEAFVEPIMTDGNYRFAVNIGKPRDAERASRGTKLARGANFECLMSGSPMSGEYIKAEALAGRMSSRLMAIVAEGERGRLYIAPTVEQEQIAIQASPGWRPEVNISGSTQYLGIKPYGMNRFDELFTSRQLNALTTFSDLVTSTSAIAETDAKAAGCCDPQAYACALATYLSFSVDKAADYWSTICTWHSSRELIRNTFGRQAIPMTWDFAETNPLSDSAGNVSSGIQWASKVLEALPCQPPAMAATADAAHQSWSLGKVVSTDPPYYDNVPYADLSDYFYVWLRRSLKAAYPELFSMVSVPKDQELVAFAYRHDGKKGAEKFFLEGMTRAMSRLCDQAHPSFPVTIYYAFKQSESTESGGQASTGWETFLEAVVRAGFALTGTWPMRTELSNRMRGTESNALASSIVLVCRRRESDASSVTRREFLTALQRELPRAIADLQRGNVAPVDLQQAAIGPGMGVFTRYSKVLDSDGSILSVRDALSMINQALDEVLAEQEGDFDNDTRWALSWFEQFGFADGEYGIAEVLSKAKATSVQGVVDAGIVTAGKGRVRLLKPEELPESWTPASDKRLTVWDMVHHLIRVLEQGESKAAELLAQLGSKAEVARELAYRLYAICDRTKRSQDAQRYNALVQSWPEISRLAQQVPTKAQEVQASFEGMN